ncbi:MAG: hypothetical protein LUG84_04125 [Akkermansiaceae bacterium]|nr:hypothetical protein [Akkermansiaceae bacterium]MCD8070472.1 hypothetical protein [Akkermansiaceae bacterium]
MKGRLRIWGLVLAFVIGGCFPQISSLAPLMPFNIVVMLTITFLGLKVPRLKPRPLHFVIVALNILIGVGAWALLMLWGKRIWAEAAFFCGITPLAMAAPVIVNLLHGKVEFTVTCMVLSNFLIAAVLPFLMPLVVGAVDSSMFLDITGRVAVTMVFPAVLAFGIRRIHPRARLWAPKLRDWSLAVWMFTLVLIAASASQRIRSDGIPPMEMLPVALVALCVCTTGFLIGYRLGYPELKRECSQCLGQKNTTITVYLAMTYVTDSPLIFLGPVFYSVFHNICNAVQMALYNREQERLRVAHETLRGGDGG